MQEKLQEFSPIKQRILQFANNLGISKREFYSIIGVSRGTLESPTGITEDVLAKFIAKYPQVSLDWLINGDGPVLKKDREEQLNQSNSERRLIEICKALVEISEQKETVMGQLATLIKNMEG